ncbi:MAG: polyamine aminopropyltransferase [Pseudomonadota bacterium]|nr:MAG: polyamine aminopropyltransferase [Pseudomonadota bacterium]
MAIDDTYFTEVCKEGGSAFSFKIKRKLHEEQTPYQSIAIYETEAFGNLMVIDGYVMLTDRDNFLYHEMLSHPALFTHRDPRRALIIGGGDCGTLREVLKHPGIESAHQVEIDERVTRLSEQFFPELCMSNDDPRATLHFGDGIQWVKDAAPGSYDVIIVDSTDPIGPAEGLFREPFYRDCLNALGTGGIVVQQSESPLYHMGILKGIHKAMRSAGYADVRTLHFPQPVYPSGWWSATLARNEESVSGFREDAVKEKSFATRYYNHATHQGAFAMPTFMAEALGT